MDLCKVGSTIDILYPGLVLLSYHLAAKKARGTSALTSDYEHGLGSA